MRMLRSTDRRISSPHWAGVSLLIITLIGFSAVNLGASVLKNHTWVDADQTPLPFQSDEEIEDYLKKAEIKRTQRLPNGITNPKKVLLERDGIRVHAVFRDVEISQNRGPGRGGKDMLMFRDSCQYERAAYLLSRILGLDNVPPVVERKVGGRDGTLQIFVEGATTAKTLYKEKRDPPNPWRRRMQKQVLEAFDNLIHNDDRNLGNILYDGQWNLWMIDHTRSFRRFKKLPNPNGIVFCESGFWEKLSSLDDDGFRAALEGILIKAEMEALLARRKELVRHISTLIKKNGEKEVLFQFF